LASSYKAPIYYLYLYLLDSWTRGVACMLHSDKLSRSTVLTDSCRATCMLFLLFLVMCAYVVYYLYSYYTLQSETNSSVHSKLVGMVLHSVSGWTRGVQVKLWDALRMCHTWAP